MRVSTDFEQNGHFDPFEWEIPPFGGENVARIDGIAPFSINAGVRGLSETNRAQTALVLGSGA
jgi:hypothetical protein